jgi:hypothetical protein
MLSFSLKIDKVVCILNEIDKLFNKIDIELDKCIKFLKNCSLNYDKTGAFNHLVSLIVDLFNFKLKPHYFPKKKTYLLDDQYYLMCKHIFTVKKYQTISYSLLMLSQFRGAFYDPLKQIDLTEDFFIIHFKTYVSDYIVQMVI